MTCSLKIEGSITVNDGVCNSSCQLTASNITSRAIGNCCSGNYTKVSSTDCAVNLVTSGLVGQNYISLPAADDLDSVAFLHLASNLPVSLRVNAQNAKLIGSGGTFPVTLSGGEVITYTLDSASFTVTFTAGTKTAQQIVNEINAAATLAGFNYIPASVLDSGQIQIQTNKTGVESTAVVGSTVTADIGFVADQSVTGSGDDLYTTGCMQNYAIEAQNIMISTGAGGASVSVLAASKL